MKNNTIVVGCDRNYFWGVFLLIASMRMNRMDEPVLVFHQGLDETMEKTLQRFGDVICHAAPPSRRNITCRKPEAMLLAQTEYITWADCDGLFVGNCSELLPPNDSRKIHVRLRSSEENYHTFAQSGLYAASDRPGDIPAAIRQAWQKDIADLPLEKIRLGSCASACILSLHRDQRDFLHRWQQQIERVLPNQNVGVVNTASLNYRQLDESVLNSLLCFLSSAPEPESFRLDNTKGKFYRHIVGVPKPWQCWNHFSLQFYDEVMPVAQWSRQNGLTPIPLPWSLDQRWTWLHHHAALWCYLLKLRRKFKYAIARRRHSANT